MYFLLEAVMGGFLAGLLSGFLSDDFSEEPNSLKAAPKSIGATESGSDYLTATTALTPSRPEAVTAQTA